MDWPNCPDCRADVPAAATTCAHCHLPLTGLEAGFYLAAVAALDQLDARRTTLVERRDTALDRMREARDATRANLPAPPVWATQPSNAPSVKPTHTETPGEPAHVHPFHGSSGEPDHGRASDDSFAGPGLDAQVHGEPSVQPVPVLVSGAPVPVLDSGALVRDKPRRDLSHHAVQNVLLLLGGLLLSIAAVVFTLVSWEIPALRALILIAFTLVVLALPWLLVRRRLAATAETVAFIGLVLIPLDGVAIAQALEGGVPSTDPALTNPFWGLAIAAAGLTAIWSLYARLAPLRLPAPTVIVLAQTPLPLAGIALLLADYGEGWVPAALIATATMDLALWHAARRARVSIEAVTSAAGGALAWVLGTGLTAAGFALGWVPHLRLSEMPTGIDPVELTSFSFAVEALPLAGVLVIAALVAANSAHSVRRSSTRSILAAGAGFAAIGALASVPFAVAVLFDWAVAVWAVVGCLVVAAAYTIPAGLRQGVRVASIAVLGASGLWVCIDTLFAVLGPLAWLTRVWHGRTDTALTLLVPGLARAATPITSVTPIVLAAIALAIPLCAALGPSIRRTLPPPTATPGPFRPVPSTAADPDTLPTPPSVSADPADLAQPHPAITDPRDLAQLAAGTANRWVGATWAAALVFGTLAVLTVPVAADLPYPVTLALLVMLAGALLALGARGGEERGRLSHAAPGFGSRDSVLPGDTMPRLGIRDSTPSGDAVRWIGRRSVVSRAGRLWFGGGAVREAALWFGGYTAVLVMCWALAYRPSSIAVAAALFVIFLVIATTSRAKGAQAVAGAGATLAAGVLAWAVFDPAAAVALLAVRAATLLVTRPSRKLDAAVLRTRGAVALAQVTRAINPGGQLAVEAAAVVVSLAALLAVQRNPGHVALVLAVTAVLAACSAWRRPRGWWRAVAVGEACVLAVLAPMPLAKAFFPALFGPYGWLTQAWAGAPDAAREALSPGAAWQEQPLLLPVLLLAACAAVLASGAQWGGQAAMGVALIAFPMVATTLPLVADLPYWAALAFLVALTAGLAFWSALSRSAAGGASLWTATLAVSWSLADQTATLAVLAAIVVTGVLCAVRGKGSPVTSVASAVTALAVGAESVAAALGSGLTEQNTALIALLVAVLISRGAALPKLPMAVSGPLYMTALVVWGVAALMCRDIERVTLVLAVGGLAAIAVAGRVPRGAARWWAVGLAGFASFTALVPHSITWLMTFARPYTRLDRLWAGSLEVYPLHWSLVPDEGSWLLPDQMIALAVGAFVTVTAVAAARGLSGNQAARTVATVAVPLCLVMLPAVARMPYVWHLVFLACIVGALAVQAVLEQRPGAAGWLALVLGTQVLAWSLASEAATIWGLGAVTLIAAAAAIAARSEDIQLGAAAIATLAFGGLTASAALSFGLRIEEAAFAVLAASALAAMISARLSNAVVALTVELSGWFLAGCGVLMALAEPLATSLALACAGALALAVALRRDRRWAVWPGLGLLQLALWIKLVVDGVTAPEAYTVPLTVAGLIAAWLARRRDLDVSSWLGYGSALALTFLPSLVVAWNDPAMTRPLVLGTAAFATTLAGAWSRLQAPLILGGAVLLVTAAHEFAPTLADLVDEGPRWVPIAVAGAFLLFTGATYEHRLRDLRKVRGIIVRMR